MGEVLRFGLHSLPDGGKTRPTQFVEHQLGISWLVFKNQHAEGGVAILFLSHHQPGSTGGWLRRSQYMPSARTASVNCSKSTGFVM